MFLCSWNLWIFCNIINGYSSCSAFAQFDWLIIGQDSAILPLSFQLPNKTENAYLTKLSQILGKLRKVIKLGKILLIRLVSDYFSENSRWVFGQFLENLRINRKPWENDLGLISWKENFSENCRLMFGYFRFCHLINYLLTGCEGRTVKY